MLDPLRFSDPIVRVYEECVDELLINLARHFNVKANGITESFRYEVELLARMGAIRKESAAIIARHVAKNEPMIRLAVEKSILEALETVEPELEQAAKDGLLNGAEMTVSKGIQNTLNNYSRQAVRQTNLVNTVMLDGTLKAYRAGVYAASDIVKQLTAAQETLNIQTGRVILGESTLQSAVRAACQAMQREGITGFIDNGGKRWSAEAYVRMDIKTTCSNAANQGVLDRNQQYKNDLVWVRTNATARPGCYPWQGKVISMENRARDVVDGAGKPVHAYAASETTYGQPDGIWGINCHHGPMNVFIPGVSRVRGTNISISQAENDRLYKLTQEQRRLEREVRYAKREAAMYDAAGDKESFEKAALKVKDKSRKLKAFVNEHDSLVMRSDRTQVLGYNRSVSAKSFWAVKNSLDNQYSTPASGRFLLHTDRLYVNASKIKPIDGFEDFVIHGDKYGFEFRDHEGKPYKSLSVKKFVEMVKESPVYKGGAIRLIACEAGADGSIVAQGVADLLKVDVLAPSDVVWVHPDGNMTIGEDATSDTGEWRIFKPRKE